MVGCIAELTCCTDLEIRRQNPFSFSVLFAKSGRDHGGAVVCVVMYSMGSCLGAPGDPN